MRKVLEKKDEIKSADELRESFQKLQQKSLKLFEMVYKKVTVKIKYSISINLIYSLINLLFL